MPRRPSRLPGLFVAGTDTDVGKTFVACAFLRFAHSRDRFFLPYKPAESGTKRGLPRDAAALRDAAGATHLTLDQVCPHRFAKPVAPAAATLPHGPHLSLRALVRPALTLLGTPAPGLSPGGPAPPLLVEAAGGLLSPYAPTVTGADLAVALALPVLLVARDALGTINHTALAIAECRRRGLALAAVVLVATAPSTTTTRAQRNADLIQSLTGIRPWTVPHFALERPAALAAAATHLSRTGLGATLLAASQVDPAPLTERRVRRRPSSGK